MKTIRTILALTSLAAVTLPADDLPRSSISFKSSDAALQEVFDAAEKKLAANIHEFAPGFPILVEGGSYHGAWIETQPMGGEMYAKRNTRVALNNQLVFLRARRDDGRLPAIVLPVSNESDWQWLWDSLKQSPQAMRKFPAEGSIAVYSHLQGYCFPMPAYRTAFWTGAGNDYLIDLAKALEAHDDYLWRARDSNGDGILESWCIWDTGEDNSTRYLTRGAPSLWPFETPPLSPGTPLPEDPASYLKFWRELATHSPSLSNKDVRVPFQSMDLMAHSFEARIVLAKIAAKLGTGREKHWLDKSEDVRKRVVKSLWDESRGACFDRDRDGKILPELIHNNLRLMHHGVFTQAMADTFVQRHLLNPEEFWTPFPLPSIAANEPLFDLKRVNSWSGLPEGLTYQRTIRALENYGHFAELSLIGRKLLSAVIQNKCLFAQEMHTKTGVFSGPARDGYSPMMLAALETISRMHGIDLAPDTGTVRWSSLDASGRDFCYSQQWGEREFTLLNEQGTMRASVNGQPAFSCTAGVRVVTGLDGKPTQLVGISPEKQSVTLTAGEQSWNLTIAPNQVFSLKGERAELSDSAPFPLTDSPYPKSTP